MVQEVERIRAKMPVQAHRAAALPAVERGVHHAPRPPPQTPPEAEAQ